MKGTSKNRGYVINDRNKICGYVIDKLLTIYRQGDKTWKSEHA